MSAAVGQPRAGVAWAWVRRWVSRWVTIRSITVGLVMNAIIRIAAPQRGHTRGSRSKIRRNSSAQCRRGVRVLPERERHGFGEHDGWCGVRTAACRTRPFVGLLTEAGKNA